VRPEGISSWARIDLPVIGVCEESVQVNATTLKSKQTLQNNDKQIDQQNMSKQNSIFLDMKKRRPNGSVTNGQSTIP